MAQIILYPNSPSVYSHGCQPLLGQQVSSGHYNHLYMHLCASESIEAGVFSSPRIPTQRPANRSGFVAWGIKSSCVSTQPRASWDGMHSSRGGKVCRAGYHRFSNKFQSLQGSTSVLAGPIPDVGDICAHNKLVSKLIAGQTLDTAGIGYGCARFGYIPSRSGTKWPREQALRRSHKKTTK